MSTSHMRVRSNQGKDRLRARKCPATTSPTGPHPPGEGDVLRADTVAGVEHEGERELAWFDLCGKTDGGGQFVTRLRNRLLEHDCAPTGGSFRHRDLKVFEFSFTVSMTAVMCCRNRYPSQIRSVNSPRESGAQCDAAIGLGRLIERLPNTR